MPYLKKRQINMKTKSLIVLSLVPLVGSVKLTEFAALGGADYDRAKE
jgi:hypothetical protein